MNGTNPFVYSQMMPRAAAAFLDGKLSFQVPQAVGAGIHIPGSPQNFTDMEPSQAVQALARFNAYVALEKLGQGHQSHPLIASGELSHQTVIPHVEALDDNDNRLWHLEDFDLSEPDEQGAHQVLRTRLRHMDGGERVLEALAFPNEVRGALHLADYPHLAIGFDIDAYAVTQRDLTFFASLQGAQHYVQPGSTVNPSLGFSKRLIQKVLDKLSADMFSKNQGMKPGRSFRHHVVLGAPAFQSRSEGVIGGNPDIVAEAKISAHIHSPERQGLPKQDLITVSLIEVPRFEISSETQEVLNDAVVGTRLDGRALDKGEQQVSLQIRVQIQRPQTQYYTPSLSLVGDARAWVTRLWQGVDGKSAVTDMEGLMDFSGLIRREPSRKAS